MSIFNNQSLLDIEIDCGNDLTAADEVCILYTKPSGTTGTYDPQTITGNIMRYDFQPGDIDQSGNWQFQGYVVIGGKRGYTDIITKTFLEPLLIPLIP